MPSVSRSEAIHVAAREVDKNEILRRHTTTKIRPVDMWCEPIHLSRCMREESKSFVWQVEFRGSYDAGHGRGSCFPSVTVVVDTETGKVMSVGHRTGLVPCDASKGRPLGRIGGA